MLMLAATAFAAPGQFRGDIGAMIIDSDPIVKIVLTCLLIFSVISWAIIIQKWIVFKRARKSGEIVLNALGQGGAQSKIAERVRQAGDSPITRLYNAAQLELDRVAGTSQSISPVLLENIEGKIKGISADESMSLLRGLGFLASISNASPFIGLFGTVWGIMDSFREIGLMGSANLSTVAPGISEALVATAAGLFVAIPAVLFYNYFNGVMDHIYRQMDQFRIEYMNWTRRSLYGDRKQ
jgi:biopolymer transport protein TolQ